MTGEAESVEQAVGKGQEAPLPLLRVYLFGEFQLAWQVPSGMVEAAWDSRTSARALFKLLLCAPGRQATKSALAGILWPETDEEKARESLRSACKVLRKVLRTADGEELLGQRNNGEILKLAEQLRLWVDADAFDDLVAQASRTAVPEEALALWQQAKAVLRGEFLADDQDVEWAGHRWVKQRRQVLWMARCRMIRHLADLYIQRGQISLAEETLEQHIARFPTDQDALYRLLVLLEQQRCFEQACMLYERTRRTLEAVGKQPASHVRAYYEHLRKAARAQEQPSVPLQTREMVHLLRQDLVSLSRAEPMLDPQPPHAATAERGMMAEQLSCDSAGSALAPGVVEGAQSALELPREHPLSTHLPVDRGNPLELPGTTRASLVAPSVLWTDVDVLSRLSTVLDHALGVGEREVIYADQQTRLYWRAREGSVLTAHTLYAHVIRHLDDLTTFLARSLLPTIRLSFCEIVCRTVLLAGILLYDMGQYEKARQHYQAAFRAATEAHNPVLQALVWGWISFTWTYARQYPDALLCVQQASHFAEQTPDIVVQGWLGAVEAEIQAHLHNRDACLQSLMQMECAFGMSPSQDISYLFEFNPVLLLGYKGVCLQQLYRKHEPQTHPFLQEAKEALEHALASDAPTKRKLYYLSDLAGVYARQGEVETACSYVTQTVPFLMQLGSGSKTIRQHLLQARSLLRPYEHTSFVRALDEQMAPLLVSKPKEEPQANS